jgi:hypothetical protein
MGVPASGATLEIQLVADVARLQRDMKAMQDVVGTATDRVSTSLGGVSKSSAAMATQMAAGAQAAARAATAGAAGYDAIGLSSNNARIASLEFFHITKNLTEQLAMGVSPARAITSEIGRFGTLVQYSGGNVGALVKQLLTMVGVLQVTQDAELAATAATAAGSAAAIKAVADRAAATLAARKTQVALAEAELAGAESADLQAAAQGRLVKALRSAELAAGKATVAQEAFAAANAEAAVAAEASAAATTTSLSTMGTVGVVALLGVALIVGELILKFRDSNAEVEKATDKLKDHAHQAEVDAAAQDAFAHTMDGVEQAIRSVNKALDELEGKAKTTAERELEVASNALKEANGHRIAAQAALTHAKAEATLSFAMNTGSAGGVMLQGQAAEDRIGAAQKELDRSTAAITAAQAAIDKAQSFVSVERAGDAAGKIKRTYGELIESTRKQYLAQHKVGDELERQVALLKTREQAELDALKPGSTRNPRGSGRAAGSAGVGSDHGLADAQKQLETQIDGQNRLAAAYQASDQAAIKAEALQKAEEAAIRHKGETGIFYAKELALDTAKALADGGKQVNELRNEADARAAVNGQVAAGLIPISQAGQELELEAKLRPLAVRAAMNEGEEKKKLVDTMRDLTKAYTDNNAEIAREADLKQLGSKDEEIAKLRLETELIGASNRERAVRLAQLEAEQFIRNNKIAPEDQADLVKRYVDAAAAAAGLQTAQDNYNNSLSYTAELLSLIDQQAQQVGSGLADAFGSVGQGISTALTALTGYAAAQAKIDQDHNAAVKAAGGDAKTLANEEILYAKKSSLAKTQATMQALAGLKSLFKEHSTGYKVMTAIEKAYADLPGGADGAGDRPGHRAHRLVARQLDRPHNREHGRGRLQDLRAARRVGVPGRRGDGRGPRRAGRERRRRRRVRSTDVGRGSSGRSRDGNGPRRQQGQERQHRAQPRNRRCEHQQGPRIFE